MTQASVNETLDFIFRTEEPFVEIVRKVTGLKGEALAEKAFRLGKEALDPQGEQYLEYLLDLSSLYFEAGKYSDSENLEREALQLISREFGSDHPDYSFHLYRLVRILRILRRFDEAEQLCREGVENGRRTLGSEHLELAMRLSELAETLVSSHKNDEAEVCSRDALEIARKSMSTEDPRFISFFTGLADVLSAAGRLSEAEIYQKEALDAGENLYGIDSVSYANLIVSLAASKLKAKSEAEANLLLGDALKIYGKVIDAESTLTEIDAVEMASLIKIMSVVAKGSDPYQEASRILKKALVPEHPFYEGFKNMLASISATRTN
ncbi:hypothetical protein A9Q94_01675 [Rhodobacterales bacterium 56_14_T64]|nr:hypothetical protein A9Q94_01675 [Rhodobacterales bacterium 56_14_T64]